VTDLVTTPEPDQTAPPEADEPEQRPAHHDLSEASPNAEAAKWRRRLRDTEAERDELAEQLQEARRQLVEQHTAGQIAPEALWASGVTVEQFVTDDGTVDVTAVDQAVDAVRRRFGIAGVPKASPRQGTAVGPSGRATWHDALADR
jgi:hypothetical protein